MFVCWEAIKIAVILFVGIRRDENSVIYWLTIIRFRKLVNRLLSLKDGGFEIKNLSL